MRCIFWETSNVKDLQSHEISHIKYKALVSDEIRRLRLESEGDELRCELFYEKLGTRPSYVALSYSWGDEARRKRIVLNGKPFSVTTNLEEALRQMRSRGIPVLWVDTLCIKQDDNDEKSRQVVRMFAIYQRADEVAVWTGPHADGSEVVMKDDRRSPKSRAGCVEFQEI